MNRALLWLILSAALLAPVACGKKGPPRLEQYNPPKAPESLGVLQRYYPREALVYWSHGGSEKSFVVMRSEGGTYDEIARTDERQFMDTGLSSGTAYYYSVSAVGPRGEVGAAEGPVEVLPVESDLSAPEVSISIGPETVTITWQYKDGQALFNVYKRIGEEPFPMSPINSTPVVGNSFGDGPDFSKSVSYAVRALFDAPVPTEGPRSAELTVNPTDYVPSKPEGLNFALVGRTVLVFWRENPEAWVRGYEVFRSLGAGGFVPIGTSVTPAYEDRDASEGKRLYRVRALGPAAAGPFSDDLEVAR